jgi:hypothetical protein
MDKVFHGVNTDMIIKEKISAVIGVNLWLKLLRIFNKERK